MQDAKIIIATLVHQDNDYTFLVNDPINANVLSAMQIDQTSAEKLSNILQIKIHQTTKIKSPWQEEEVPEEVQENAPV